MRTPPPIRQKFIPTPEELESLFDEYVNSVPQVKMNVIHPKLGIVEMPNDPPVTMRGFMAWGHKIKGLTLRHYLYPQNDSYDAYSDVVEYIQNFIFDRNFSGAACGKYKEQLIKAFHSIAEKTENKNENITRVININPIPSGTPIATNEKEILLD